jgi:hypothetical protein
LYKADFYWLTGVDKVEYDVHTRVCVVFIGWLLLPGWNSPSTTIPA